MAEMRFDGRVAVVTGAGNGLGRAHALLLAARGARVVVNDLGGAVDGSGSDAGAAEKVVAEIRDAGGEAIADGHSVAEPHTGAAIVQTALDAYGRIDVVVNNAGNLRTAPFAELSPDDVQSHLGTHILGAFNVTRAAWPHFIDRGYGRVVNTTSTAGLLGSEGYAAYGAAKGGIFALTRVLALEGAPHGIRVNALAPTAATRMLTAAMGDAQVVDPEAIAAIQAMTAALDPSRVSPVVAYLAHEDCDVTGEVYAAGGGLVTRLFLGQTPGYFERDLSPEAVRDHLAEIRREDGYRVPRGVAEDTGIMEHLTREAR